MAIDYPTVRTLLANLIEEQLQQADVEARVYPEPPETDPGAVAVIVGQPNVNRFDSQPCIDAVDWPVGCVVAVGPAGNYRMAQQRLEALWPAVAEALRTITDQGQLTGVGNVVAVELARAEFGDFSISGQTHPAQVIHVIIHG